MPLKGVKVIELAGLAPGPFCGQVLCDFGAEVIRVDRVIERELESLKRGKKLVLLDLKKSEGKEIFKRLCKTADVLIDIFRPGVMERLELGPDVLLALNPRLIYARITGFGQTGYLSQRAGHDINYLAISGILSKLGSRNKCQAPVNILSDFAGGGLMAALGVCMALFERTKSGKGQVIDANLTEGSAYLCSWLLESMGEDWMMSPLAWPHPDQRESNLLDGGAPFYRCYETKDKKFMAVGAQEYKFYLKLLEILGLDINQYNRNIIPDWDLLGQKFEKVFATKTQEEWIELFDKVDCCVTPVLDIKTANQYRHNVERDSFFPNGIAKPAPILSRTPATPVEPGTKGFELNTKEVLLKYGYSESYIKQMADKEIIGIEEIVSKL